MLVWKVINYSHMTAVEKQRLSDEVRLCPPHIHSSRPPILTPFFVLYIQVMILKDLRSPFIVQYHEHVHDRANKRLYIVMEHCPRGDLRQLIKECRRDG
jgi:serine/threonine protein kinase